jgi:acyl carrier protein
VLRLPTYLFQCQVEKIRGGKILNNFGRRPIARRQMFDDFDREDRPANGGRMNEETIYSDLTKIFHEVFDDDTLVLRPQMTAADVKGWDSFKQVEILIAVQERFRLKLRSQEIDALTCVGDLVEVIERNYLS